MFSISRSEVSRGSSGCLWGLGLLLSIVAQVHGESLDNLGAIVWTQQTRSFSDPDRLSATLQVAPTVAVKNPQGSSPSELIKRQYGFGASDSPEAYAIFESKILALNNAADATHLPAGRVVVPDLPTMTSRSSAAIVPEGPVVRNRSMVVDLGVGTPTNSPSFAYTKPISIADRIRNSLNYTRVDRYLATEAQKLVERANQAGVPVLVGSETGIQLSGSAGGCNDAAANDTAENILSKEESDIITSSINASPMKIERYVIVLDTGWPTYEQQLFSLRTVRGIFDAVRTSLRLPTDGLARFDPELRKASFVPPTHAHACMILQSLREFVALDQNERLKVLYLPLRPGQPVASEYFRELIELDQLIEFMGGELFSRSPTEKEMLDAKKIADSALVDLTALNTPWPSGDDVVRIYEPLVSGLIRVLDTYSRINSVSVPGQSKVDARFWISLSWNFTRYAAAPSLPASQSYMLFAAAGNDKTDFVAGRRLFASEAASNRRVFAVMNSDEKSGGLTCSSAVFGNLWEAQNVDANVASFPGRLSGQPTSLCPGPGGGTSFSTPRLAWLSAAADIAFGVDGDSWWKALEVRLLKSRLKIDIDQNSAPISVKRLFDAK